MLTRLTAPLNTVTVFYISGPRGNIPVEVVCVNFDFDKIKKALSNNLLWVPVVVLAVVVSLVVRGNRQDPGAALPDKEPTISVFLHNTGETVSMPLETYLEGVVAAEMDPNWPLSALEAQAIVARTFTLKRMESGPIQGKGTDASTDPREFQAYNKERVNDRVRKAVQNTRGQLITYRGKPIIAWFHASSGGKTASAVEGLNFRKESAPYAAPVTDLPANTIKPWFHTFTASEILAAASAQGQKFDQLTSIRIGKKGPSGRAETLIINDKEVSAPAFRLAVGDREMKSTFLDEVRMEGNSVVMKGRGDGHGVGMSQWGAWLLAQRGKSAQDIVHYYFKGIKLQHAWR